MSSGPTFSVAATLPSAAPTQTITPAGPTTLVAPAQFGGVASGGASLSASAAPPSLPTAPPSTGAFAAVRTSVPMPTGPITAPMLFAYPPVPPQPGESTTNFGPQLSTYPTMNQSYFALSNQVPDGPETWSLYPALQNVDISGYDLLAVGDANVQSLTITTAGTCVLTSDICGDLLVNGQGLPDDASNWSNYPALKNVDISGFTLEQVGAVELINGTGTATLTSDPSGELLVNGQLLPDDASNWSLYPALQNVDMSGNALQNVSSAQFVVGPGVVVLTTDASGYRLYADAETVAYLSDVSSATAAVIQTWSLYPAISNLDMSGNSITDVSSLTLQTGGPSVLTSDASGNLLVNGQLITGGPAGSATNWSFYPAISGSVDLSGSSVVNATSVSSVADLSMNIGNDLNITAANDINIGGQDTSIIGTGTTQITANPKVVGAYGDVQIDAYGSVVPLGNIGFGGLVEITAHTPVATIYTFTSAVKLSGACITSYAGALTPLASLAGVNYVHGDNNVNITSGLPAIFPNLPLQTYIYGTGTPANGGVKLESSNGVEVPNGTIFYADEIRPYYNPFSIGPPPNLRIGGLARLLYTQYVDMDKVNTIAFDSTGTITQLQVINTTLPLSIQGSQTVATSAGTTATMTGGTGASVIATTGTAALTATAGAAQVNGGTTATMTGGTGTAITATTGNATMTAAAGSVDLSAGTTMSLTANSGTMTLATTGSNDINLNPGTSGGVHILSRNTNPGVNPEFKVESTNGGAGAIYTKYYKNSATPANGDGLGTLSFHGNNSGAVDTEFCEVSVYAQNVAAGAEQGYLNIDIASPGLGLLTSATFLDGGVKPAAIYDTTASRGINGQYLTTTGTAVQWATLSVPVPPATGMTATGVNGGSPTVPVSFAWNGQNYISHIFNSTAGGTFTITSFGTGSSRQLDMLIVGGGGGGSSGTGAGVGFGGGGGAGAVVQIYNLVIPDGVSLPLTFNITVGTGGTGVIVSPFVANTNGGNSSVVPAITGPWANQDGTLPSYSTWTALGGQRANTTTVPSPIPTLQVFASNQTGTYATVVTTGGGGGGSSMASVANTGRWFQNQSMSCSEQYVGGAFPGGNASGSAGGGGGGAFTKGEDATGSPQTFGGRGYVFYQFDGTARAVGGGGSGSGSLVIATGRNGLNYGGGTGASAPNGAGGNGSANTGGGGGAGRGNGAGGAGGSGLVIIRYRA